MAYMKLTRSKAQPTLVIEVDGQPVRVTFDATAQTNRNQIRISVDAPRSVHVVRAELLDQPDRGKKE